MASNATRNQILASKTAGISNRDTTKQLDACRKTVFNVYRDCYNFKETYFQSKAFDSYLTNWASNYEASETKSSQEHEENSKSARDIKIICAEDILKY